MDLKSFLILGASITLLLVMNNRQRKFRKAKENAYWRGLINEHTKAVINESKAK
jgi:hypothetical protein